MTRVLVADAMPMFGAGVNGLLEQQDDFESVQVQSLAEALDLIALFQPDIVLVDLDLPPAGGIEAVERITAADDSVMSIVWSLQPSRDAVLNAIRAGAKGFMRKDTSPDGLLRALRGVSRGEAPLSRELVQLMIEALHGLDNRQRALELAGRLSGREQEVLMMVAEGARNREIAGALAISEFTVKRHVQNILHKLGMASRNSAAAFYRNTFGDDAARFRETGYGALAGAGRRE
ncbi:MAG: LuxR C-terminal-related transcriptional regulator [Gaiellaceae bacterium]